MDYERALMCMNKLKIKTKVANYMRETFPIFSMKIQYFCRFHKYLNLKNPITLSELTFAPSGGLRIFSNNIYKYLGSLLELKK